MRRRWAWAAAAAAALAGCGGTPHEATKACDPLADEPQPITLGKILGVGRDANGALYVIDQPPTGDDRLFVSNGTALQRQPVMGTGEGNAPDGSSFVIVDSGTIAIPLEVEIVTDGAGTVTMGLVRGAIPGKTFTIGSVGETLTVVSAQALVGLELDNLPGTIDVEYLATLADGRTLMVTRPDVDWTYSEFRVFFGLPPALQEREVMSVVRGSFTVAIFDVDGAWAAAHFSDGLSPGPSTLQIRSQTFDLTVAPSGTLPASSLSFRCF